MRSELVLGLADDLASLDPQRGQAGRHCPEIRSERDVLFAPQLTHSSKIAKLSHATNKLIRVYLRVHCDSLREIR